MLGRLAGRAVTRRGGARAVPKRADVRPRKIGVKKLDDRVKGLFKRKEESAARA